MKFMNESIKGRAFTLIGGVFLVVLLAMLLIDVFRRGVYRSDLGINIAVVGNDNLGLLLLRPDEDMVMWIKLPSSTQIKIYNSSASYPVTSLWSFGLAEKDPYRILEKSLGQSLGIIISGTIKLDEVALVENVLGKLFSISLKTDLSVRDRVLIRSFLVETVKSKKMLELSIPRSVFEVVQDPDGKEQLNIGDTIRLWTKNKFVVEGILNENVGVSINNISGISGRGAVLTNQLESTGMHVLELKADLEESVSGDGCLFWSNGSYVLTEFILKEHVGCKKIAKPAFVEDDGKLRIWIK